MVAGTGMIRHKSRNVRISGLHPKLGKGKESILPLESLARAKVPAHILISDL